MATTLINSWIHSNKYNIVIVHPEDCGTPELLLFVKVWGPGTFPPFSPQETLDSLSDLYTELNEKDLWAGLWTLRCQFPQTVTAIAFESQGHFEQVYWCVHIHVRTTHVNVLQDGAQTTMDSS